MSATTSTVSNPDSSPGDFNIEAAMDQHDRAANGSSGSTGEIDWPQVVAGGLLLGWGLSRGSVSGLLIAAAGGGLAYRGLGNQMPVGGSSAPDGESSVRVEKAVTVNRSIDDVYAEWREIERLPHIMSHLESVQDLGNGMSHWVAKAPLGRTVEWDAEIIHDHEGRVISWRSVEGAQIPNVGAVHFHEAPGGDRGTEVRVRIEYTPPAGRVGATVAKLFGEEPGQQVSDDLRRFKRYMETGEIPTTEGQPRGGHQHSVMDVVMDKARQGAEAVNAVVKGADTAPNS